MRKYILAVTALLMVASVFVVTNMDESDAATEYPITIMWHPHATIYVDNSSQTVTNPNSAWEFEYGTEISIVAIMENGYSFNHWYGNNITEGEDFSITSSDPYITINGQTVTWSTVVYGEEEYTLYLSGSSSPVYTVTFVMSPGNYGTLSESTIQVPLNTHWNIDRNAVFLQNYDDFAASSIALPIEPTAQYTYAFDSWSRSGSGTINADTTFTAYFTRTTNNYTVSIQSNNTDYGTVSTSSLSVPYGTAISSSGTTLTVGGNTITASPHADNDYYNYAFSSWSTSSGTVTGNLTITATFTQTVNDFAVTVMYNANATIYVDNVYQTVTSPNSAWEYQYLTEISIVAIMDEGYTFNRWYGNNITEGEDYTITSSDTDITISGQTVTWSTVVYGEEEYTLYLNGPAPTHTITFAVSPGGYGSVSESSVTVSQGTQCVVDGNHIYLHDDGTTTTVTATAAADTLEYTYLFDSWSRSGTTTISEDTTITAYFTRVPIVIEDGAYWSNGMYNGVIDMVFQFESSDNRDHLMSMPLFIPITADDTTTWADSGYDLEIELSYPALYVTATISHNGSELDSNQIRCGMWNTFQLTIDTKSGNVIIAPVDRFNSFVDYTIYDNQSRTVLDWSNELTNATVYSIEHEDSETGTNPVRFSVASTDVFLNTYGIVLYNPTINIYDYFPQYDSIRVNIYSFALYGESMTINGVTYTLDGSNVTVSYVDDNDRNHYLPSAYPDAAVKTKTMELTNIYVTWDDTTGHCQLTFVNDRFTIDLGEYQAGSETISFAGMWYFTTAVYEPYTTTEKQLGDWQILPNLDQNQMLLIFLGVLLIIGVAAHIKLKGSIFDLIIIGLAALVSILLLG